MYCRLCDIEYPKSLRFCKWCGGGLVARETIAVQHCPSCGSKTEREWIFCNECGVDLATLGAQPRDISCPSCSATVRKGWMFCRQCGEQIATERAANRCDACSAGTRPSWTYCKQCGANLKRGDPLAPQQQDFKTVAGIPALPLEEVEPFSDLKSGELPPLEDVLRHEAKTQQRAPQPAPQLGADPHQGTHPFTTSRRTGHLNTDSLEQEFRNHTASVTPASHGRLEASEILRETPLPAGEPTNVIVSQAPAPSASLAGAQPPVTPIAGAPTVFVPAPAPPAQPPPSPVDPMMSTQVMSTPSLSVAGFQETAAPPAVQPPPTPVQPAAPPVDPTMSTQVMSTPSLSVAGFQETAAPGDPGTGSVAAGAPMFIPPEPPPQVGVPPAPAPAPPQPVAPPAAPAYQDTGTLYASQPLPAAPQMPVVLPPPGAPQYDAPTPFPSPTAQPSSGASGKLIGIALGVVGLLVILAVAVVAYWLKTRASAPEPPVVVAPAPAPAPGPTETPKAPEQPGAPTGMVLVPAGSYVVGSNDPSADAYSKPSHPVELKAFYLDVNEVTNEDYKVFVDATGHAAPPKGWDGGVPKVGTERMPVVYVTWQDATDYAKWAGKRLPTESEWEAAARGADGRAYTWGNNWDTTKANVGKDPDSGRVVAVGSYASGASPYGANDMIGNVWEWTSSGFAIYPGGDKSLDPFANTKVIRGGAFDNDGKNTAMYRGFYRPDSALPKVGFRCAKDAP